MAGSDVIKHSHDAGTIVLKDGTGTPLTVTVRYDKADFEITGFKASGRETTPYETRGKLRSLRKGKPVYPKIKFSCMVSDISSDDRETVADFFFKRFAYASRVSTTASIGDADAFNLLFTMEGTDYGDAADQAILAEDIADWEFGFSEGEPNTFSITGTVYGNVDLNATDAHVAPRG